MRQHSRIIDAGLRLFDLAVLTVAMPVAHVLREGFSGAGFGQLDSMEHDWTPVALTLALWMAAAWMFQVYDVYRARPLTLEISRLFRATAVVALAVAAAGFLAKQHEVSRLFVGLYFAVAFALLIANRIVLRTAAAAARRRGHNTRYFTVVGSGELAEDVVETMASHPEWGYSFAGYILEDGDVEPPRGRVLGALPELSQLLDDHVLDQVIFAVPRERLDDIESAVLLCKEQGIDVMVRVAFFDSGIARMSLGQLGGLPMLSFSSAPRDELALAAKRALDVVASAAALLLLSPLLAATAVAIQLESPGPILFRQRRVGLNGRPFTMLKFRSMYRDAEGRLAELRRLNEASGPVFKMRRDPRVTRVGRFIRRTSIDELPQFWNVLAGDMSVVGPRPPIPAEVRQYKRWQRRRLSVKPGLTCTWQVSGRSDIDFERWMELDLEYIDHWSLWRDIQICLKTIPAVLTSKGAR